MSTATEIKEQVRQQIRSQIAANTPQEKTFQRFLTNVTEDITSFGKGLLGIGREVVTNPIESVKTVGGAAKVIGGRIAETAPDVVSQIGRTVVDPVKQFKELKRNYQQLKAIPYQEQKKLFDSFTQEAIERASKPSEKIIAGLGGGLVGSAIQEITHPIEFAYEKPFTFGLDVMTLGGGKIITKGTKAVAPALKETRVAEELGDLFIPNNKLKRSGFGDFADDFTQTNTRIFNTQSNIIKSTAQKLEKDLGLNAAERLEFFETVDALRRADKGVVATSQNPKIQSAIEWWIGQEVPKLQKASGLPDDRAITNYLHHFFPEKMQPGKSPFKKDTGFLKKSEDITGFSKDPVVSISAIKSKIASNAIKDAFIKRTQSRYGRTVDQLEAELIARVGSDAVEGAKKANKLDDLIKKKLDIDIFKTSDIDKVYLPKAIGEELNKYYSPSKATETLRKLLTPLDVFNRNWKPLATAVRPRYHTRNVIGNIYNGVVLGGMNIRQIPVAAKQQVGNYFNELRKLQTPAGRMAHKIFPQKFNTKLLQQAIDDDVIGRGFFAMDLHDLAQASSISDDIVKTINRVKNPAEIYKVPVLRHYLNLSFNIGQALEDNARLGLYIDRIKKGASRAEAKNYVNKHLFDYMSGLGDADKLIKKFLPFWSWTRFNLPLQSESLFTKPARQLAIQRGGQPFVETVEQADPSTEFFTEEERAQGLLKVGEVEQNGKILDKYIRTQSVLPQADLVRLVQLMKFDYSQLGITPLVSVTSNIGNNTDYFGREIERFTGERKKFLGLSVSGKQKEALSVIPFLSEINKFIGGSFVEEDVPGLPVRIEQILSPLGTTLKDPEEVKFFGLLKKEQELKGSYQAGLEGLFKRYLIKANKSPEEKVFKQNVEKLEQLLIEKGLTELDLLPIKIKATREAIKENIKESIKRKIEKAK